MNSERLTGGLGVGLEPVVGLDQELQFDLDLNHSINVRRWVPADVEHGDMFVLQTPAGWFTAMFMGYENGYVCMETQEPLRGDVLQWARLPNAN